MKRKIAGQLFVTGVLALLLLSLGAAAQAQGAEKVGLVVKFGDGRVFTACLDYTRLGMTGEEVLDSSGLFTIKQIQPGIGAAICKIENDGCDYPQPDSCFCECTGDPPCKYWAYYHLDQLAGEWIYSGMGVSGHIVQPRDVEGWAWGDGEYGGAEVEPPLMTFEDVCAPASPPVVELSAEPANIAAGQCSTLRWNVENAVAVTLDGEGVRPDDSRYVCPTETHLYELQVLNAAGEYSYEVTVRVTSPSPTPRSTATPTRTPTATTQPSSVPPPAATRIPQAPAVPTSPSPTSTPTATSTSIPTLVAVVENATPTVEATQVAAATESPSPPAPREQSVGLDRLLLLLGVGAGTVGFGTIAFVAMLVLLIAIYLRARTQF